MFKMFIFISLFLFAVYGIIKYYLLIIEDSKKKNAFYKLLCESNYIEDIQKRRLLYTTIEHEIERYNCNHSENI